MERFAFECYADLDVFVVCVKEGGHFYLPRHVHGHGEVFNALIRRFARVGMVDEDPGRPRHRERDRMQHVWAGQHIELRTSDERWLLIVKPELEESFVASMAAVGLTSALGMNPRSLRALLGTPRAPAHKTFRDELTQLRDLTREQSVPTLVSEIGEALGQIPTV